MTGTGTLKSHVPARAHETEGYRAILGTSGRTRTGTLLRARDFEFLFYNHFVTLIDVPRNAL